MSETFQGKAALIFGGGLNIGRAVMQEFAARGARVAVSDINLAAAQETADLINAAGGEAIALACDVTDTQAVHGVVDAAEAALGHIDIVMNNAGLLHSGNPEDMITTEWQRMFDCNVMAMARSNEAILPRMLARGRGHIVNTASFAGSYPFAVNRIPYASSKAAVLSLTMNMALYLIPKGIKVSCLCPGPVMTDSMQRMARLTEDATMHGPGSHLDIKTQQQTAMILADGMESGRVLIPTHEELWETLQEYAKSPDAYLRKKLAEFENGDYGIIYMK